MVSKLLPKGIYEVEESGRNPALCIAVTMRSAFRIEHCPVELAVIKNLPNGLNGRFLIKLFQVIHCQDDHSQNSQHNASCTV